MDCKTCEQLLADYRGAVGLFKDAVHSRRLEWRGGEFVLAAARAARWGRLCQDASDALIQHWRRNHHGLASNADSR